MTTRTVIRKAGTLTLVVVTGILGAFLGLAIGSYAASNEFEFLGNRGYEAGGVLGMIIGGLVGAGIVGYILWRRAR